MIAREFLLKIDGLDLSHLTDPIIKGCIFRNRGGIAGALKLPIETTAIGATGSSCPFGGTSITSINFTELTGISTWAFQFCNLTNVDLSNCAFITTIGHNAFNGNTTLTSLKLPASSSLTIDYQAFQNNNLQGDLEIPSTNTTLGYQAFANNPSLRSITFTGTTGTSLDMSGYQVFSGCSSLEYIDMSKVTTATGLTPLERTGGQAITRYMFSGTAVHTLVYLPQGIPDDIINGAGVNNKVNYVRLDKVGVDECEWFYLQDGCDYYIPHNFGTKEATWNAAGAKNQTTPTARS